MGKLIDTAVLPGLPESLSLSRPGGGIGIVWSMENALINIVDISDRTESLAFFSGITSEISVGLTGLRIERFDEPACD